MHAADDYKAEPQLGKAKPSAETQLALKERLQSRILALRREAKARTEKNDGCNHMTC